jgi:hypothetical protein
MSDRQASLLTNKHRNYLQGEVEPSNVSQTEGRMFDRIEQGMFDFYILFEYLSDEQLRNVFGTQFADPIEPHEEARGDTPTTPATPAYVEHAIAFFLRGLNYSDRKIIPEWEETTGEQQPAFEHFTEAVEHGVKRYIKDEKGYSANVDVSIELDNITDLALIEYEEDDE